MRWRRHSKAGVICEPLNFLGVFDAALLLKASPQNDLTRARNEHISHLHAYRSPHQLSCCHMVASLTVPAGGFLFVPLTMAAYVAQRKGAGFLEAP